MRRPAPELATYRCLSAKDCAFRVEDFGRRPHELPWLYLDSVGQEFGPLPGRTMHEWLSMGRFPVGLDLRVRLPEWDRHWPLHQLFPDMAAAFNIPPAWPDVYQDGKLNHDLGALSVEDLRNSIRESGRMSGPFHSSGSSSSFSTSPPVIASGSMAAAKVIANGHSAGANGHSAGATKAAWVAKVRVPQVPPMPQDGRIAEHKHITLRTEPVLRQKESLAPETLPLPRALLLSERDGLPPLPKAQSVLERLLHQEQQEFGAPKDSGALLENGRSVAAMVLQPPLEPWLQCNQ
ncbi:unnamed protein product [Durusdinium trenchii]|uniref:GYF domain-containing protein n=1 Tax=Durusdinium trenchii TaxID=1381693 RepID=A0ABP0N9A1_9DINO